MSLNFDFEKIQNYKKLCFLKCKPEEEDPRSEDRWQMQGGWKVDGEKVYINPTTNAIIWLSMSLGFGEITEANWPEVCWRLKMWKHLNGIRAYAGELNGDVSLTEDDIKAHIGLKTNVSWETHNAWTRQLMKKSMEEFVNERKG